MKNKTFILLKTTSGKISFALKFIFSHDFRKNIAFPWMQNILRSNLQKIRQEIGESEEMIGILWKYSKGKKISAKEKKQAKEQMLDIIKIIPSFAIFLLPGGIFILPIIAKALPWDLLPSSFQKDKSTSANELNHSKNKSKNNSKESL